MAAKWHLERGRYGVGMAFAELAERLATIEADDRLQHDIGNAVRPTTGAEYAGTYPGEQLPARVAEMSSYQPRTVQGAGHEPQHNLAPMPGGPDDAGHAGTHPFVPNPFRNGFCRHTMPGGGLCDAVFGDPVHDVVKTPLPGEEPS